MSQPISSIGHFLLDLDALKNIKRRTYINGGERVENSAEHSWHLALSCWIFARHFDRGYDLEKLIKLALIHDLGEIDAGDTFLYAPDRSSAASAERECVERLSSNKGNTIEELVELWDEQELGISEEASFLKVIDRLLPFLHNLSSAGQAWKDNNITKGQVLSAHLFIKNSEPEIYSWFVSQVDHAVKQGWLKES